MKPIRIFPYNFRVSAAREIVNYLRQKGFDALRVYPDKKYIPQQNHLIINWGNSKIPKWFTPKIYPVNSYYSVDLAVNKILSFITMSQSGVSVPEFTTVQMEAKSWLQKGKQVIGRKSIKGKGGEGIILMDSEEDFVECPLYTLYKPKRKEFRIHVFNGKVIDFQEKRKKKGGFNGNSKIRTHSNGWVFCRENVILPEDAAEQAIKACDSLYLDFGGVDLIWNEKENKSYVLEVNSAPGIEGTTVTKYAESIIKLAKTE